MCGILLHISRTQDAKPSWWADAEAVIAQRGPDLCVTRHDVSVCGGQARISVCGSVLSLRGGELVQQPLISSDGDLMLLWNGEVFSTTLDSFDLSGNDSQQLLQQFEGRFKRTHTQGERANAFADVLAGAEGPYAVVLIDRSTCTAYYGRDPIGRRSLLLRRDGQSISLASAASSSLVRTSGPVEEVACKTLWKIDLSTLVIEPVERVDCSSLQLQELSLRTMSADCDQLELFARILSNSVRERVQLLHARKDTTGARIAVLFSGGLDCCTIALLAHKHIPPSEAIDLINVAFENPRVLSADGKNGKSRMRDIYDVPDRLTAVQSFQELQSIAPERTWRLVKVDVTHSTYLEHRPKIESLMAPCTSVMDLSIAAALYFAARGEGREQHCRARVLLSGLGADELLGGYSRHRMAFLNKGREGLIEELQMDLDRLPTRNLGRDDRIISSSGKEVRYPFLDRAVIDFLADLPVEAKMQLSLPPGVGDKLLLRRLARNLGLEQTSSLAKRAIQFGARSAKMEEGDGRIKGHQKLEAGRGQ